MLGKDVIWLAKGAEIIQTTEYFIHYDRFYPLSIDLMLLKSNTSAVLCSELPSESQKRGFRHQKWFMSLGQGVWDGGLVWGWQRVDGGIEGWWRVD